MKPAFNGEMRVRSGKKIYVLRPSFASLWAIEQEPERALHYLCDAPPLLHPQALKDEATQLLAGIEPFSWEETYRLATGVLGLAREEFWQMTPQELQLCYEGYCIRQGLEPQTNAPPPSRNELQDMMQQFPD